MAPFPPMARHRRLEHLLQFPSISWCHRCSALLISGAISQLAPVILGLTALHRFGMSVGLVAAFCVRLRQRCSQLFHCAFECSELGR